MHEPFPVLGWEDWEGSYRHTGLGNRARHRLDSQETLLPPFDGCGGTPRAKVGVGYLCKRLVLTPIRDCESLPVRMRQQDPMASKSAEYRAWDKQLQKCLTLTIFAITPPIEPFPLWASQCNFNCHIEHAHIT